MKKLSNICLQEDEERVLLVLCSMQLSKLIQSSMCLNNEKERDDKASKF